MMETSTRDSALSLSISNSNASKDDDILPLQSPSVDDSRQDHRLIRNSVTSDSHRDDQQPHCHGEGDEDDGSGPHTDHGQNDDDHSHHHVLHDDTDLINDIMNQKSNDDDYDFKLVETMDMEDDDDEHIGHDGGVSPIADSSLTSPARTNATNEPSSSVLSKHASATAPPVVSKSAETNSFNNNGSKGSSDTTLPSAAATKKQFHAPKLMLPHQIAAMEKQKQAEQQQYYSSNSANWHSYHPPPRISSVSSHMYGQVGYYHPYTSAIPLQSSSSSISSYHPAIPASLADPAAASPMSHSTKSSTTQPSRKRLLPECSPEDAATATTGGNPPIVVNMKRTKSNDSKSGGTDCSSSTVANNPARKNGTTSTFLYDPYNSVNHIHPHYTTSADVAVTSSGEHRRNWSSCSTASSLSMGGLSSLSSASFDHGGVAGTKAAVKPHPPRTASAAPATGQGETGPNHLFGHQPQHIRTSSHSSSGTTTAYSKFDLLSMEDTSVLSSRMFTANGKPLSTSPIMGAGSASTASASTPGEGSHQKKKNASGNPTKLDPGVTPISKNTSRERSLSHHPYHSSAGHAHHENTFSFTETPGPSSGHSGRGNGTSGSGGPKVGLSQRMTSNMTAIDTGERRDAVPTHEALYREHNSFTPIPMSSSRDDIDDVHGMSIQPNLSWSIMGETSPLGEMDAIDPWSSTGPPHRRSSSKDSWSRGNAHDILALSTLSPNSDTGIKSPCLANVFDHPHPEERENMVGGGGGLYHPYHQHQHPRPHSTPHGYSSQLSAPTPQHYQHDPHSAQIHHMFVTNGGRTPPSIKAHVQQEPHGMMRSSGETRGPGDGRQQPPPTPMASTWSAEHYGPQPASHRGAVLPGHVKSSHSNFMNRMPHNSYPLDSRDEMNSTRSGGSYFPPPSSVFRPAVPSGGSDRVINLRGRAPPPHHGSHAPQPPPHYDQTHHAPLPHHHPGASRSTWGRPGQTMGPHHPHPHHHVGPSSSSTHPMMAPPSSQHANTGVDAVHSRRKCVPLKPPIPSKFQGDIDKFKDAPVPEFTNLVNFPANIANKMAAMAGEGMKICVMCGAACPCSSLPKGKVKSEKDDGRSLIHHHKQLPNAHKLNGTASSAQGCYAIIPTQNKGLCTFCDVNVWVVVQNGLEIKWCKGCKNFRPWAAFGDKGLATKCVRCRDRQREKYALQKEEKEKARSTNEDGSTAGAEL